MNAVHFDRLTRRLRHLSSRRGFLRGGAVAAGLAAMRASDVFAGKRKNKKKVKLNRNQYGCVNVGGKCRGRDKNCCSGVCDGKKPGKGEKDTSRCKAHDTGVREGGGGGCRAQDESLLEDVPCMTTAGREDGLCWRTTGNAGHCGFGTACVPCRKDRDCVGACGAGAACIAKPNVCGGAGVVCSGTAFCDPP